MAASPRTSVLAFAAIFAAASAAALPPDGQGVLVPGNHPHHVSPELHRRLVDEVNANLATLQAAGHRLPKTQQALGGLTWPLGPVQGIGTRWHAIVNFVDLDRTLGNPLRDYTCGTRTYDNHNGIDYFLWPFPWTVMDAGAVDILAVASGTLVAKEDGHPDRSCSFNTNAWPNYVVILHADGSVARYLHMKTGSVTPLPIGAHVQAGTPLGKVGSSGISTGPHLHLELYTANTYGAPVIEPHRGACNIGDPVWADERPYNQPRVNRVSTHGAPPQFATCPSTHEQPNFKDRFVPGDPITVMGAFRDYGPDEVTDYRILRPDGSVFESWSYTRTSGGTNPAAYLYWNRSLPLDAPLGIWTFEASFHGDVARHGFQVVRGTPQATGPFPPALSGSWYNVQTAGQGFNIDLVNENRFLLYFYGYHDDGEQLWLYGDYNPGGSASFAWDTPLQLDMYVLDGGGFQNWTAPPSRVWGTATIMFESCRRASIQLTGESGTQVLQLDKLNTSLGLNCP